MKILQFLIDLRDDIGLWSTERPCQHASNSELRRWLQKKSVLVNGQKPGMDDEITFPITELVLHPKSKDRKCTLC